MRPPTTDAQTAPARIAAHLSTLVSDIGARPSGSPANRRAADYLVAVLREAGLDVRQQPFESKYWEPGAGALDLSGRLMTVSPNPFSPPCDVRGRVVSVHNHEQIGRLSGPGLILVLRGGLTHQAYFPKAFPFMSLPEQLTVIASLEAAEPAAVIAVTDTGWPPIFEDADLGFPSATVAASVGAQLPEGGEVGVHLAGHVHDGVGVNVSAGSTGARIVLCAHIDTKATTPGNGRTTTQLLGSRLGSPTPTSARSAWR